MGGGFFFGKFLFDGLLELPLNIAAVLVGPIAASILVGGNVGVILLMFPAHVAWAIYTLVK